MKRIRYGADGLVTSDDVAEAVLSYAAEVSRAGGSATVDIPVLRDDGSVQQHSVLLNNASQLDVFEVDGLPEEKAGRFEVPEFPPVDTRVVPVDDLEAAATMPELDEDGMPVS